MAFKSQLLKYPRQDNEIAIMGIKWNELISTDPDAAWSLASTEIAREMFKSERIIVPRLEEAQYFDLLACFATKGEKTALEKIFFVSVACQNFVKADVDQRSIYQDWKSPDGQKEIKIIFHGISRKVINWASLKKGSLLFQSRMMARSVQRRCQIKFQWPFPLLN